MNFIKVFLMTGSKDLLNSGHCILYFTYVMSINITTYKVDIAIIMKLS